LDGDLALGSADIGPLAKQVRRNADGDLRRRSEVAALSAAALFSSARAYRELDVGLADAGVASRSMTAEEQLCSPVS